MRKVIHVIDRCLEYLLVFLMAAMVLNVLWQVITRFVFVNPSTFTGELARYLLIWLSLFGASYVSGKQQHLAIDFLPARLGEEKRKKLQTAVHIFILVFALLVMVVGGANLVSHTFYLNQLSAALRINLGFVYLALPLSGSLIMFYSVHNIVMIWQKREETANGTA